MASSKQSLVDLGLSDLSTLDLDGLYRLSKAIKLVAGFTSVSLTAGGVGSVATRTGGLVSAGTVTGGAASIATVASGLGSVELAA